MALQLIAGVAAIAAACAANTKRPPDGLVNDTGPNINNNVADTEGETKLADVTGTGNTFYDTVDAFVDTLADTYHLDTFRTKDFQVTQDITPQETNLEDLIKEETSPELPATDLAGPEVSAADGTETAAPSGLPQDTFFLICSEDGNMLITKDACYKKLTTTVNPLFAILEFHKKGTLMPDPTLLQQYSFQLCYSYPQCYPAQEPAPEECKGACKDDSFLLDYDIAGILTDLSFIMPPQDGVMWSIKDKGGNFSGSLTAKSLIPGGIALFIKPQSEPNCIYSFATMNCQLP